ncbi:SLC13 family permease [Flaviflexus massiliensis]|uniref:SLC13 family permease n=1 Tax=Flaviflexus massiliensis TaxID=1522309 RepID=UPI0006D530DF|nr:DASS family sodium-coupled anion symporter [Flaviflexus massiliensis]
MSTPIKDEAAARRRKLGSSMSLTKRVGLIVGILAFLFPLIVDIPNLPEAGERMLAIFLLAIVFWITEPIPLVATAVLVILLEVLMISAGTIFEIGGGFEPLPAADYFSALANPVIILFLGGFMIAEGAEKYRLDKNIAAVLLKPFAGSIRLTVLGLMIITALLSMFMSNTATTATMFAVIIPIIAAVEGKKAKAGFALAIPLAANVGGIGTPVGTPPNAIAVGALAERGIQVSFIDWMIMAVPLMLVVLFLSWLLLCALFLPREGKIEISLEKNWDSSPNAKLFYSIAALTIVLWMTEPIHGVSSNIVGFFPVVALLSMKVMSGDDIKKLDWPVLWLVSGGIALGTGVAATELDVWLVESIPWETFSPTLLLFVFGMIGLGIANVISHSAAANLLVPLAVSLAFSLDSVDVTVLAVVVALACSFGMSLPISTPPNAIAYSTGEVSVKHMALVGVITGFGATLLLIFAMPPMWELLGLV